MYTDHVADPEKGGINLQGIHAADPAREDTVEGVRIPVARCRAVDVILVLEIILNHPDAWAFLV